MGRLDKSIADHIAYETMYGDASEWLSMAEQQLSELTGGDGNKDVVKAKRSKMQVSRNYVPDTDTVTLLSCDFV